MEIRIKIPISLSAWRYHLKNPKDFLPGNFLFRTYGFKQYLEEYLKSMQLSARLASEERAHQITRDKLIEASKELSKLKRHGKSLGR